jgi:2-keto-3-deoxy-L-arabinonate dehydratase
MSLEIAWKKHCGLSTKFWQGECSKGFAKMKTVDLHGVVPILPTPFESRGEIDIDGLKKIVRFAAEKRAGGICTPAYASEFYKLSDDERRLVIETAVTEAQGRLPVIACIGHPSTRVGIEIGQFAQAVGADMLCVLVPRAVPLDSEGIFHHIKEIAEATDLPLMLQDADFTGSGLAPSFLVRLKQELPNLLYAKIESVLPGQRYSELLAATEGRLKILCGWAGMYMLDALQRGACGVMPGCGLVDVYQIIYTAFKKGDLARARSTFFRLLPPIVFSMQDIELVNLFDKTVCQMRGIIPAAVLREPTRRFDAQYLKEVQEYGSYSLSLLEELGLESSFIS